MPIALDILSLWSYGTFVLFVVLSLTTISEFISNIKNVYPSLDPIGSGIHPYKSNTIGCSNPCFGTADNDIIIGSPISDQILGLDGNDSIQGNGGNDTIFGGNGNDTISGGTGFDILLGEDGNDVIIGDSTTSLIESSVGNQLAEIDALYDILLGSNFTISSNSQSEMKIHNNNDTNITNLFDFDRQNEPIIHLGTQLLDGGMGDDYLLGQNGDEDFIGGPGHDYFDCGEGTDFVLDFDKREDTVDINCEVLE